MKFLEGKVGIIFQDIDRGKNFLSMNLITHGVRPRKAIR